MLHSTYKCATIITSLYTVIDRPPKIQFLYAAEYIRFPKEDGELDELFSVTTLTVNCAICAAIDLINKTLVVANKLLIHMNSQSECLIRHYLAPIKTYADRSVKQDEYFCIQRHTFNRNRELVRISAEHHNQLRTHIYKYMFRIPAEYYLEAPIEGYPYKPIPEFSLKSISSRDRREIIDVSENDLFTYRHKYEEVIKMIALANSRHQHLNKTKEETLAQMQMQTPIEKDKRKAELNKKLVAERIAVAERAAKRAAKHAAITANIAKKAAERAELKKAEVEKVITETAKTSGQVAKGAAPDSQRQTIESEIVQRLKKEAKEQIAIEREKCRILEQKLREAQTSARSRSPEYKRDISRPSKRHRSPTPEPKRRRSPASNRYRSRSPTPERSYKHPKQSREYWEHSQFPAMSNDALEKRRERFTVLNKEEELIAIRPMFEQLIPEEDIIDLNLE